MVKLKNILKDYTFFKKNFIFGKNHGLTFCEWEGPEWYLIPTIAFTITSPELPDSAYSKISFSIEFLKGVFWIQYSFKNHKKW